VPTKALEELFFIFLFFSYFFETFPHYLKLFAQIWLFMNFFVISH
jgi:hypothetical protein